MLLIWSSSTIITSWQTLCLPQCSCNSSSRCTCTQALTPIHVAACLPSRCCRQPKVLTVFISAAGGWFAATWSRKRCSNTNLHAPLTALQLFFTVAAYSDYWQPFGLQSLLTLAALCGTYLPAWSIYKDNIHYIYYY